MNQLLSRSFGALQATTNHLTQIVQSGILSIVPMRTKKIKTGGSSHNRRRHTPGKYRRLYVNDGDWVEHDHLLVRQLGLQFYPGQNVMFTETRSLKALYAGHVLITMEKLRPYPDSALYPYVAAGNVVERKFIHVIPPERVGSYKLVETV